MLGDDRYTPATHEALEDEAMRARDLARLVKAQHDAYVEAGFAHEDALRLTINWQSSFLGGGPG